MAEYVPRENNPRQGASDSEGIRGKKGALRYLLRTRTLTVMGFRDIYTGIRIWCISTYVLREVYIHVYFMGEEGMGLVTETQITHHLELVFTMSAGAYKCMLIGTRARGSTYLIIRISTNVHSIISPILRDEWEFLVVILGNGPLDHLSFASCMSGFLPPGGSLNSCTKNRRSTVEW